MAGRQRGQVVGVNRRCVVESLEDRRLFAAGGLDQSFSTDGRVDIDFGGTAAGARDVAVQADGKTVIVGAAGGDFGVARLNVDGTVDRTFGPAGNGRVRTHIGTSSYACFASAVAIQPDGKIVVAGTAHYKDLWPNFQSNDNFALARYLPDGTLDKSFDGDGKVIVNVSSIGADAYDVAIQNDGKIVVVGGAYDGGFTGGDDDFMVVRLNSNGSLDTSFNTQTVSGVVYGGTKRIGLGRSDDAFAVAIDYNGTAATNPLYGSIVVAGISESGSQRHLAVARLTRTGAMSNGFDGDGKRTLRLGGQNAWASSVFIQPGGSIVVAGTIVAGGTNDFMLARFTAAGALDASFGGAGTGYTTRNIGGDDQATSIIRNYDGNRLLVGGSTSGNFAVAQYTMDGVLDTGFGNGTGRVITGLSSGASVKLASGPGRRFVAAGGGPVYGGGSVFHAVRYLDAGANVVSASTLFRADVNENGSGGAFASFFVTRSERLPYATRVYINQTGTATGTTFTLYGSPNPTDYYGGFGAINFGPTYIDIPAGQSYVEVQITPVNDTRAEGDETVVWTVQPNSAYDIGIGSGKITIHDDEVKALTPTADAYVRDGSSWTSQNFGDAPELQVRNTSGNNRRTYLKFDLSSVSLFGMGSAKLRLWGSASGSGSVTVGAYGATSTTWSESSVNWNNKPGYGSTAIATTTVTGTTGRWYELDLTSYLRAEKAAGRNIVTIVLRSPATSTSYARFNSREAADLGPQLWIAPPVFPDIDVTPLPIITTL